MQNIDPILFVQPILSIATAVVALAYWRRRRGYRWALLLLSLVAYAGAIMAKVAIQAVSYSAVSDYFGQVSVGLGLYFGVQTVLLEVGLAYVLARYAARRTGLSPSDGVAYGISLGFWENAVLIGALPLVNLTVDYYVIASGSSLGQQVYNTLMNADPAYFLPSSALAGLVVLGSVERVSSLFVHVAFGTLVVLAVITGRKRYLLYALPMGMVDALVPFANLNLDLFEGGLLLLSIGFLAVTWLAMRSVGSATPSTPQPPPESVANTPLQLP